MLGEGSTGKDFATDTQGEAQQTKQDGLSATTGPGTLPRGGFGYLQARLLRGVPGSGSFRIPGGPYPRGSSSVVPTETGQYRGFGLHM